MPALGIGPGPGGESPDEDEGGEETCVQRVEAACLAMRDYLHVQAFDDDHHNHPERRTIPPHPP